MPLETITIGKKESNDEVIISEMALGSIQLVEFYKYLPKTGAEIRTIAEELVQTAYKNGINCFDTADMYGMGVHEKILGDALLPLIKKEGRKKIVITTKVGIVRDDKTGAFLGINCSPDYIKTQCEESIKRLGIGHLDIYFLHRPDEKTKIEDSIDALILLKQAGKIKHFGLSEFPPELIERAQAHAKSRGYQIAAIQNGYSILNRKIETDKTIDICKNHGIIIFAHSPLANGLGSNTKDLEEAAKHARGNIAGEKNTVYKTSDQRRAFSELSEENISSNKLIADQLNQFATQANCTRAQFSLSFIKQHSQTLGILIIPVVGTKTPTYIPENVKSNDIKLNETLYLQACTTFPVGVLKGNGEIDYGALTEVFQKCPARLTKRGLWPLSTLFSQTTTSITLQQVDQ